MSFQAIQIKKSDEWDSDGSLKDRDYIESESDESSPSSGEQEEPTKKCRADYPTPEKKPKSMDKYLLRKTHRNVGSSYTNKHGKKIKARVFGPPCGCKKNCRILLRHPKKRMYPKKTKRNVSSRNSSFNYFVKVNRNDVKICKKEFISVHGLTSQKRFQLLQKQMFEGSTTPKPDQRGKYLERRNKISEEACQSARDHINSIPKYTSPYSREKNPNKTYIDHDLNISSLYHDYYKPWCTEKNIIPVSQDKYRRIFCSEFNIGFKLPRSDTCKICDELDVKIENTKGDEDSLKKFKIEKELHLRRAAAMKASLNDERELATAKDTYILSFDLQQALPVPSLTTGPAFYLRKAWVYNLGIHDCVNDKGYMYMWPENVGKRGSDEIASILYKHFKEREHFPKNLIVYTDNCGGQNKNWVLMSLSKQLVAEGIFDSIEHRFLVVGHTHLPSDRDFAMIERYKKKMKAVYEPSDWYDAVKKCKRTNPFEVTILKREDFFSFKILEENLVKKKLTDEKDNVSFNKVCLFRFENGNPNIMKIKHYLNESFKNVNIGKRGVRKLCLADLCLMPKYVEPIKLNPKKVSNLALLLPYIPEVNHQFYLEIGAKNSQDRLDMMDVEDLDENRPLSDD